MKKILSHYTETLKLINELNEHIKCLKSSWGDTDKSNYHWKKWIDFSKKLPKLDTKSYIKEYKKVLPKSVIKYINKRESLEKELKEFLEKDFSSEELKEKICKIMSKDPAFKWVKKYGYTYGYVFRAISDCSDGSDLMYNKAYNKYYELTNQ